MWRILFDEDILPLVGFFCGGWLFNLYLVVQFVTDELSTTYSTMMVSRIIGVFIPPIGGVLGFFLM